MADFVQGTLNVATANKQEYHDTKTCNLASCRLYCTIYSTVCKPHCTRIYMTYFKLTNILDSTIQYIAKQSSFHFCFGTLLDRHYKCYVSTVSKSTDSHPTQLCVHWLPDALKHCDEGWVSTKPTKILSLSLSPPLFFFFCGLVFLSKLRSKPLAVLLWMKNQRI